MRNAVHFFALIFASVFFAGVVQAENLAIINGTVIDSVSDEPLRNATILIEDGRIREIGVKKNIAIPEDAQIIDARGKYITPGLMDANVHLMLNIDPYTLIRYEGRYDEIALEAAQLALKNGLTTVFDTWGPLPDLVKTRDKINAGEAVGARVYIAGNIIGYDGPLSLDFNAAAAEHVGKTFSARTNEYWEQNVGRELMWFSPTEVRERVREYANGEIDFLKYGASGHSEMYYIAFSERVQKAIIEEGRAAGKTVQAHTSSIESLDMAITAGVDIATHCDISGTERAMTMDVIKKLVDNKVSCSVLPITKKRLDALSATTGADSAFLPYMKISDENIRNMIKAGATLLMSTDAGIDNPVLSHEHGVITDDTRVKLGEGHFNALVALEEKGMSPHDILKSATINIARAYKVDNKIGSLESGKVADMIIFKNNPLQDARNYRSVDLVIKDGHVVDRSNLPTAPLISNQQIDAEQ